MKVAVLQSEDTAYLCCQKFGIGAQASLVSAGQRWSASNTSLMQPCTNHYLLNFQPTVFRHHNQYLLIVQAL